MILPSIPTPNSPVAIPIAIKVEARLPRRVGTASITGVPTDVGEATLHLGTFLHAVDGFANVAREGKGVQIDVAASIFLVAGTHLASIVVRQESACLLEEGGMRKGRCVHKASKEKMSLEHLGIPYLERKK